MVTCHVAQTKTDLLVCQDLVREMYAASGYVDEAAVENGIASFNPGASTIIAATKEGQILGTITLVADSEVGLPMEGIYGAELRQLREKQSAVHLAEVCQFAVKKVANGNSIQHNLEVSVALLRYAADYARASQLLGLCFTINPKHQRFYESLGAVQIGEERKYPHVNNAPALAYYLDAEVACTALK